MAAGMAEATRDLSSRYAIEREQFGRPIGVNQAIKHRCADMAVRAEAALAQTVFAALVVDSKGPDAVFQAHAAKVFAVESAARNAAETVQVHGGMGFTWEHTAHRYVERAQVLDHLAGDRRQSLASILAESGPEL